MSQSVLPPNFAPDGQVTVAKVGDARPGTPDPPHWHEGLNVAGVVYSETIPPEEGLLAYGVPASVSFRQFSSTLVSELCRLHKNGAFDRDCLHDVLLRAGASDLKIIGRPRDN